jgi:leucyl-tRNA synthetase
MLAPFAPHVAEELWEALGHEGGILRSGARWPEFDEQLTRKDEVEIAVQVNGKLRGRVNVPASATEEETRAAALSDERVRVWTEGKQVVKTVVVPGRLVNVVVK